MTTLGNRSPPFYQPPNVISGRDLHTGARFADHSQQQRRRSIVWVRAQQPLQIAPCRRKPS